MAGRARRLLIPEAVLERPAVVRQLADEIRGLADAQRRTEILVDRLVEAQARAEQRLGAVEERVGRLEEGQVRLESALARLAEALARTDERVGRLEEGQVRLAKAQQRTDARLDRVDARLNAINERLDGIDKRLTRVEGRLAGLRGDNLEQRYRQHADGYFGRLLRRARVVGPDELDDLLDEGLAAGALDEESAHDVRLADLVVRGRRPGEDRDSYVVIEVSAVVEPADVECAMRRAAVLGRVRSAMAAVGGEEITPAAIDLAHAHAVWRIENGRVEPPTVS